MPDAILAGRVAGAWLLAALIAGAAWAQTGPPAAIPVGTVAVENRAVTESLTVVGRIAAVDRVDLTARVDGFLDEVSFTEGDRVAEGDLLYRIEPGQFEADVRAAQGALDQRRAEKALADLQLARAQELMEKNTGTVVARDQAKAEADRSAGAVETAEAQLATARIKLGYTEIRAPIAGRIGLTTLTKGAVVGPSSGVLATIVSDDPMHVVFPVSAREFLRQSKSGEPIDPSSIKVTVRSSDGTIYPEHGVIDFIDVTVNQATDTVQARATLANPDRRLIDGQLVTVILEAGAPVEQPAIPQAALIADQGGVYVFVVEDGKAAVRRIKPGGTIGPDVWVSDGLEPGDQVIVEGIERIRPGAAVLASPLPPDLGTN
jgi:membrane fusion protein (multidrug efflux system)